MPPSEAPADLIRIRCGIGHSVGRWEHDVTFAVTTIGLDDQAWLDNAGNVDAVRVLVDAGADVMPQATSGRATASMFAVRCTRTEVARRLAEKGARAVTEATSAPEVDLERLLDLARNEN